MEKNRLNDELTIVALVLMIVFMSYYLIIGVNKTDKLHESLNEARTVSIMLDERLTSTELRLEDSTIAIQNLEEKLIDYTHLEEILKDIASSWESPKD